MPSIAVNLASPQLWGLAGQHQWSETPPSGRVTHAMLPPGVVRVIEPVDVPYRRVWQLRHAAREPWFWYYLLDLEGSPSDWHLAWRKLGTTAQGMQLRVAVVTREAVDRELQNLPTAPRVLVVPELLDAAETPRDLFKANPDACLLKPRKSLWLLLFPAALLSVVAIAWLYYPQPQPAEVSTVVAVTTPEQRVNAWNAQPDPVAAWLDRVVEAMPAGTVLHSYTAERDGEWHLNGTARQEQALQSLRLSLLGSRLHSAQRTQQGWRFNISGHVR